MGLGKWFKKEVEPAIRQPKKTFNNLVENLDPRKDKQDRAEKCFKEFEKSNIKMCDSAGNTITKWEEFGKRTERDFSSNYKSEHIVSFCKKEFSKHNIVPCNELQSVKEQDVAKIFKSEECFELFNKNNIEICFEKTKTSCKSSSWETERTDWNGEYELDFCKEAFMLQGLVPCDTSGNIETEGHQEL